jgi:hypothetical protein
MGSPAPDSGLRRMTVRLAALLAGLLACAVTSACGDSGGTGHGSERPAARTSAVRTASTDAAALVRAHNFNDGDNDPHNDSDPDDLHRDKADIDNDEPEDKMNPENDSYHDKDDGPIAAYGHPASRADSRQVVALVKRYYAAAAAANGSQACSMMLARLRDSVVEDYGRPPGPAYLRGGKTCAEIATRQFRHAAAELSAGVEVTGVRVNGANGLALLRSAVMPASYVPLEREGRRWRIVSILGQSLP